MQASFTSEGKRQSGIDLLDLDELVVWDPANWVEIILRRSEQPSIRISGDDVMVKRYRWSRRGSTLEIKLIGNLLDRVRDALRTSLTRKQIQIELMVSSLDRVQATGIVEVILEGWQGDEPEVYVSGPTALWGGRFTPERP